MATQPTRRMPMQTANKKRSSEKQPTTGDLLAAIAKQALHISTLETRHSDSLDFYQVSVWSVKDALEVAYRAGLAAAKGER